jgi:hypothetical protein
MSTATDSLTEKLFADLYETPGKAEIVGGRIATSVRTTLRLERKPFGTSIY